MGIATTREQRIADREQRSKLALQARYDEIETFRNQTPVKAVRTGGRAGKLASMLEFIEAFGPDVLQALDSEPSYDDGYGDESQDVAPLDSFSAPIVHVSPKAKECRARRLQAISARIMRRESKEHARACYGQSWTPAMILSRRGIRICEAILRESDRTLCDVEFGNTDETNHIDRLRVIKRIHASRKSTPKGWEFVD